MYVDGGSVQRRHSRPAPSDLLPPAFSNGNGSGIPGGRQKSSDTDLPLWGATKANRRQKRPVWLFVVLALTAILLFYGLFSVAGSGKPSAQSRRMPSTFDLDAEDREAALKVAQDTARHAKKSFSAGIWHSDPNVYGGKDGNGENPQGNTAAERTRDAKQLAAQKAEERRQAILKKSEDSKRQREEQVKQSAEAAEARRNEMRAKQKALEEERRAKDLREPEPAKDSTTGWVGETPRTPPTPTQAGSGCEDKTRRSLCNSWKRTGECERNAQFMRDQCAKTCGFCTTSGQAPDVPEVKPQTPPAAPPVMPPVSPPVAPAPSDCVDKVPTCGSWAEAGECERNSRYMKDNCPKSCGLCPVAPPPEVAQGARPRSQAGTSEPQVRDIHLQAQRDEVKKERSKTLSEDPDGAVPKNYHPKSHIKFSEANGAYSKNCQHAADRGQCHSHSVYMAAHCPRACNSSRVDEADNPTCKDFNVKTCEQWAKNGECERSALYLSLNCPFTCYQRLKSTEHAFTEVYGQTHGCTLEDMKLPDSAHETQHEVNVKQKAAMEEEIAQEHKEDAAAEDALRQELRRAEEEMLEEEQLERAAREEMAAKKDSPIGKKWQKVEQILEEEAEEVAQEVREYYNQYYYSYQIRQSSGRVMKDRLKENWGEDIDPVQCKTAADELDQCKASAFEMSVWCPNACKATNRLKKCTDFDLAQCESWAQNGECENSALYMSFNCPRSCHKQLLADGKDSYARAYAKTHACADL
mmetsp:Transcript_2749/g.10015  ORF Transcript_2749/g.10015 Transcript_2749/m.10015 type:complete len:751 (-) Transcript_2749:168-2420(-)